VVVVPWSFKEVSFLWLVVVVMAMEISLWSTIVKKKIKICDLNNACSQTKSIILKWKEYFLV
jgi:hypothetical protein